MTNRYVGCFYGTCLWRTRIKHGNGRGVQSWSCKQKHWFLLHKNKHFPANICWSWRRLKDVFKTCLEDIFNMSSAWQFFCLSRRFEDVLEDEKLLRRRRLKDALETNKFLLGISVSNKSKCVSNKSVFHKSTTDESKASPKWIN